VQRLGLTSDALDSDSWSVYPTTRSLIY